MTTYFNGKKETTSKRFQPFRTSINIACKSIIAGNTRISIVRARQKGLLGMDGKQTKTTE